MKVKCATCGKQLRENQIRSWDKKSHWSCDPSEMDKPSSDMGFSSMIQKILTESGYATDSISSDEEGTMHRIRFTSDLNNGEIHTGNGKILYIKGSGR